MKQFEPYIIKPAQEAVVKAVSDVYRNGYVVPEGYEAVDFRPPTQQDTIIPTNTQIWGQTYNFSAYGAYRINGEEDYANDPRLIVKPVKRKVVTFRHTGKFVNDIPSGSWYHWPSSNMYYQTVTSNSLYLVKLVELVERTETEV